MADFKICIFKSGVFKPETKITIPLNILRVVSKLILKKASAAMEREGINLNEIVALSPCSITAVLKYRHYFL